MWEIEVTDEFLEWWRALDPDQREALTDGSISSVSAARTSAGRSSNGSTLHGITT